MDKNERTGHKNHEKIIEDASKLLNYCPNTSRIKKERLIVESCLLGVIIPENAEVTCIALLGQYLFAGDSIGRVRVYSLMHLKARQAIR